MLSQHGVNRRDFMKLCAALAATMGLSSKAAAEIASTVSSPSARRLSGLVLRNVLAVPNHCYVPLTRPLKTCC